jgi:scyllo-inositol 2-dehydrogenase (NADP+)
VSHLIETGLLAYGMSGRVFHAPFLAAHPGFRLRAVVERHEKTAAQQYPGIVSYGGVEALMADPALELIVVNTPTATHFDYACQALRAGKHVLVEKPVALNASQARELWELAKRVDRQVFAYQNRRYDADFLAVRRIIASGRLGRIFEATFRFDRYKPTLSPKLFKETPGPGAGLLYDLGPHVLDQVISLWGRPLHARKTLGTYRLSSEVDDYFSLDLTYPDGLHVRVAGGLLIADPQPAFVLHGTHGSYQQPRADGQEGQLLAGRAPSDPDFNTLLPNSEGRLTWADSKGQLSTVLETADRSNYLMLFEDIYQTLQYGSSYPVLPEQILWQSELLEMAPSAE